ncbi:hypothetical protein I308_104431 [Cryptococcus tetragattii IND107]|uniref:Uncharacterized protein n=1 Tax=Cryptococcus tetragattii IND107 TaxID=1296105 RepID=A0ABR3BQC6_9TREE
MNYCPASPRWCGDGWEMRKEAEKRMSSKYTANRSVSVGGVNEDNFLLSQLRVNMGFISYHVMIWMYELDSN